MYNLDYYKNLEYRIIVEKDSYESQSWYIAYSVELGKKACFGQGDKQEEAISSYLDEKDDFIEMLYDLGHKIPEPELAVEAEGCNGKISFRTTPQMHFLLLRESKRANSSLNLFINNIVAIGLQGYNIDNIFKKMDTLESKLDEHHSYAKTKRISYNKGSGVATFEEDPFAEATDSWHEMKIRRA